MVTPVGGRREGRPRTVAARLLAHYIREGICEHTTEQTADIERTNKNSVIECRAAFEDLGLIDIEPQRRDPSTDSGGRRRVFVRACPSFRTLLIDLYGIRNTNNAMEKGKGKNNKNGSKDGTKTRATETDYDDLPFMQLVRFWGKHYDAYFKDKGVEPFTDTGADRVNAKRLVKFADVKTVSAMVRHFFSPQGGGFREKDATLGVFWNQRFLILEAVKDHWRNLEANREAERMYPGKPEKPRGPETITVTDG